MKRGLGRRGESGQVLPWVAVALVIAVVLALFTAKTAIYNYEQIRLQSSVDATALAAATVYARGMNVNAILNQLLIPAAIIDAVYHCPIPPKPPIPSTYQFSLIGLQDKWVTVASVLTEVAAFVAADGNGINALPMWNDFELGSEWGLDSQRNASFNLNLIIIPSLNLTRFPPFIGKALLAKLATPVCGDDIPYFNKETMFFGPSSHKITILGTPPGGLFSWSWRDIRHVAVATAEVHGGNFIWPAWGVRLTQPPYALRDNTKVLAWLRSGSISFGDVFGTIMHTILSDQMMGDICGGFAWVFGQLVDLLI